MWWYVVICGDEICALICWVLQSCGVCSPLASGSNIDQYQFRRHHHTTLPNCRSKRQKPRPWQFPLKIKHAASRPQQGASNTCARSVEQSNCWWQLIPMLPIDLCEHDNCKTKWNKVLAKVIVHLSPHLGVSEKFSNYLKMEVPTGAPLVYNHVLS